MTKQPITAAILIIGNEILSGKVVDSNSPFLCKELRFLGVDVQRILTIPDHYETIGREVKHLSELYTYVFTSGGIGPTHDDVTIAAIAAGFQVELEISQEILNVIKRYYSTNITSDHERMAQMPKGSVLLYKEGLPSPQVQFRNIFIFPGIPELLKHRFSAIKEMFRTDPILLREIFLQIDEGDIAQTLNLAMSEFPELLLGSYPTLWRKDYTLKLTLESRNKDFLNQAFDFLLHRLPKEALISTT